MSTFLGLDYGRKKTGIAIGQNITQQARPLTVLPTTSGAFWPTLDSIIAQYQPMGIVLGRPLDRDQQIYDLTEEIEQFGAVLAQRYQKPIYYVDEHLTSKIARGYCNTPEEPVDAIAAALILEDWLDSQGPRS